MDAATEFFIQIYQTVVIFPGLYIYILAYQFRYIRQRFCFPACALHNNLVCDYFFTAIDQTVF